MTIWHSVSACKVCGMCHIKTEKLSFDIISILKTCPNPSFSPDFTPKRNIFYIFEILEKFGLVQCRKNTESGYKILGAYGGIRLRYSGM